MAVKIRIETENEAFQDGMLGYEVEAILAVAAKKIKDGANHGVLFDSNGNRVGTFDAT